MSLKESVVRSNTVLSSSDLRMRSNVASSCAASERYLESFEAQWYVRFRCYGCEAPDWIVPSKVPSVSN